ncbi:MAG TPA: MFS transporter [Burkholderiales bacterium]|nr:MFS transporter [Burkholderiales bacterium]
MYLIVSLCIAIHLCYIGSKVVVSLLAVELGASQATIGLIAALYGAAPLLLGVHAGRLCDTAGMRPPLLAGAGLVAAAMLAGFLFPSVATLFLVATLMGAGFVYYNVAIQNLAGSHGLPEHRARNFSTLTVGYSASAFIGPMFAGFAIDWYGHIYAFLGFALVAALPVAALLLRPQLAGSREQPAASDARRSALDLLRIAPLRRVVVVSGLMVAAWELFLFYMPLHGHALGLSASAIGMVLGTFSIAAFIARFALPLVLRRVSVPRLLSGAMLAAAAGFLLLPALASAWLLAPAAFAIGLVMGVGQPLSMTMAFERSPAGRTGEVTGLRLTANNVARVVVPLASGALGAAFGASPVFWMNALNLAAVSWLSRR